MPKTARIGGQRRYAPDAVHHLAVLQLARKKQQELDEQTARLKAMRRLLDRVLQCQCVELPECGRIAASVMESASQ